LRGECLRLALCLVRLDFNPRLFMMDRRSVMTAALAAIAGMASSRQSLAQAGMSRITAYAFSFPGLAGGDIRLSEFAGRPILIVNTASLCGFTPQYGGLQELWTEFSGRGLMIIGVPSNDFGGQEPGGAPEITATAQNHHVTFPIAAKAVVKGPKRASVLQIGRRRRGRRMFHAGTSTNT
jgi:glutathione peroxidase